MRIARRGGRLRLAIAVFGVAGLVWTALVRAADEVWFEDHFATADGKPAEYPGFKDFQATEPLPNAKGTGGGYNYFAYAYGQKFDGYVMLGAKKGQGLIAKFATVQTAKTWRLADVPAGKILRFEMKGVVVGKTKRDEVNEGFGLSDCGAIVHHLKDVNNIIWTFYRPRKEVGGIRPYVQWSGDRASVPTADISVNTSADTAKPDNFTIEYDPANDSITFLHNGESAYVFSDPKGMAALAEAPLAIVFCTTLDNIETIEMESWSLRLVDSGAKR